MSLRLGKLWKISSSPRRRGSPRRGHVIQGEPEDRKMGHFGPPR